MVQGLRRDRNMALLCGEKEGVCSEKKLLTDRSSCLLIGQ